MAQNYTPIKGTARAIGEDVLVTEMHFGEQTTAAGLIISSDDGDTRGIYPRWGKVYSKGPRNKESYEVGHWVLVEHGRWTRSIKMQEDDDSEELEIRMIDADNILAYSSEKPDDVAIGAEYADGPATIDPGSFVRPGV